MQCPQCGHEGRAGAKFCSECGKRFPATCPACGAEIEPGSKFCDACGAPLETSPAPATRAPAAAPPSPAPASYTPQHLADRILTARTTLQDERKQVTVLFADLKGSMQLLADRDPEEARAILDPVLERMMAAVHQYEGTVNQVLGDGIMALFGAPLAHEDHAVRACYAALRMQETVQQYAAEVLRRDGLRVQIRVGLNSGEVVVRSIDSDLRMDYSAIGQTVHLAARMEQTALPGSIQLAPDTLQLVEGYVQVRALGPIPINGLTEPVEVYEVTGVGATRTRLHAAAARGFTRFVGRDTELETLRQTLARAAEGHGQVVALVGEPGVGKSRLVWEFSHSHRTQGWLVLECGSVSYGKATSYLPISELLRAYCGVEPSDDPRRVREKALGKLLALDRALEPALPALLELLDVPGDDAAWAALDPALRRQRTLDALKRLLLREAQVQPVLLVCEDLHWIDAETQALLDSLVESLPAARLLLLVNYRPEYAHGWTQKTYYRQLRLDPLAPESAEALLRGLVGEDPALDALRQLLIERTEGNPFFLEESVQALVETGRLVGGRGAYRLVGPLASTQVPATVQAVLAARIDRLAPEDKRLLQAAAVIGKDVPFPLLQAIAELREEWLRQALADLQAAELLYETSLFPDLEYTFKHALTHDVAYNSLLQDRRRALHARIVEVIERLYPDRLMEQIERLAHHAVRGEVWDKAVVYLRQAAAKAAARSAHHEATGYLEQALDALGHGPPSREAREQDVDIRLELRSSLTITGRLEDVLSHLLEAEKLAVALDDQRRLGRVCAGLIVHYAMVGEPGRAVDYGQRALSIAASLGDFVTEIQANGRLGHAWYVMADYRRAVTYFRTNIASLQGDLLRERLGMTAIPSTHARGFLAVCLAELGEFVEGEIAAEEAVRIAEEEEHPYSIGWAYLTLGYLRVIRGDAAGAIPQLERGLSVCRNANVVIWLSDLSAMIGYCQAQCGRVAEGTALLDHAVAEHVAATVLVGPGRHGAWLAEGALLAGRPADAENLAARALELSHTHQTRGDEAWTLRLLGEIAARAEPLDVPRAESHYREALALADERGMRPLVAHCHLGLGTLYQRTGRADEACAELEAAMEHYRAMEMPFWLARAKAAKLGPIS